MKKITAFLLALTLAMSLALPARAASLSNFDRSRTYGGQFMDVDPNSPVAANVQAAYELGIMNGVAEDRFAPKGQLTVAQTIVVAARIRSGYLGDGRNLTAAEGEPWYLPAAQYLVEQGILPHTDFRWQEAVDRTFFAVILGETLPDEELPVISSIEDGAIPDLPMPEDGDPIYRLYRAGVLTGSDARGTFGLGQLLTRGAASAIISRLVEPELRRAINLERQPVELVPLEQLQNLKSLRRHASDDQMRQAYTAAAEIVTPLAELPRPDQLLGIAVALREIFEQNGTYTTESEHYNDPYGYFIEGAVSCAGCTRATGLCLNMLGIPYEHVNENQWAHQWCRVPVGGTYWICDAFGLTCGPEPAPYAHPYF